LFRYTYPQKMPTEKVRVLSAENRHAFWASRDEALHLVRGGHARSYGTRKRMLGVILSISEADAGAVLYGKDAGRPAVFQSHAGNVGREHVADKWYVWAFRQRAA
jgi:hypothetical protein